MAITISTAARDDATDAVVDQFDGGTLEIRSGAAPGPGAAPAGTLLASITLPTPAFGASSSGTAAKNGTWEDASADGTGTAAHFRLKTSADDDSAVQTFPRIEGTVGQGSGDLSLDNVAIEAGQTVTISTFTVTMPAS
jgi:hypothetical protein